MKREQVHLLDVNLLIALIDPMHVQHDFAHDWFDEQGRAAWATCPLTENGVLRIAGNARYPNSPGSPSVVLNALVGLCKLPGHVFWPDDISLLHEPSVDGSRLLAHAQVTDTYLLALASHHRGRLATFDRRLVTSSITVRDEIARTRPHLLSVLKRNHLLQLTRQARPPLFYREILMAMRPRRDRLRIIAA